MKKKSQVRLKREAAKVRRRKAKGWSGNPRRSPFTHGFAGSINPIPHASSLVRRSMKL